MTEPRSAVQIVLIRDAQEGDTDEIRTLMVDVFAGEQGIPAEWNDIAADKDPRWWCAELDSTVVGAVAAWTHHGQVHWGRFAVRTDRRGQHIGTRLARHSLEALFSQGVDVIHMDAREATVRLICGMGGRVVGDPVHFFAGTVTPVVLSRTDYYS